MSLSAPQRPPQSLTPLLSFDLKDLDRLQEELALWSDDMETSHPKAGEGIVKIERFARDIFEQIQTKPQTSSPPKISFFHVRDHEDSYAGEIEGGELHGLGVYDGENGVYVGEWRHNQRHGMGLHRRKNGDLYVGEWARHQAHGHGYCRTASGDQYQGEWVENEPQGHGERLYANGDRFEGEVKKGQPCGPGTFVSATEGRYEGEWLDGERHGRGVATQPNGHVYAGEWRNGDAHGQGYFTNGASLRYLGGWQNGSPHGAGTTTFPNGNSHTGELVKGCRQGLGFCHFANGDLYKGQWAPDQAAGFGELFLKNGKQIAGLFYIHELESSRWETLPAQLEPSMLADAPPAMEETPLAKYASPDKNIYCEPVNEQDRLAWYHFFHSPRMLLAPCHILTTSGKQFFFSQEAHQYRQSNQYWEDFLPCLEEWQNIHVDSADTPKIASVGTHLMQTEERKHPYGQKLTALQIQQKYDQWYTETIQKVSLFLSSRKDSPIMIVDLLSVLGYERRLMAFAANTHCKNKFGLLRFFGLESDITSRHPHFRPYVEPFLTKFSKYPNSTALQYVGQIGEIKLSLTTLEFMPQKHVKITHASALASREVEIRKITQAHLQTLFTEILQTQEEKILLQKIASLHWWLAQLTLFQRGSASISEILILGIFQYKGHLVEWKPTVSPDLEAMMRTEREFVADYEKFIIQIAKE